MDLCLYLYLYMFFVFVSLFVSVFVSVFVTVFVTVFVFAFASIFVCVCFCICICLCICICIAEMDNSKTSLRQKRKENRFSNFEPFLPNLSLSITMHAGLRQQSVFLYLYLNVFQFLHLLLQTPSMSLSGKQKLKHNYLAGLRCQAGRCPRTTRKTGR